MIFRTFRFDVVFSFAEENDAFVRDVAHHLKGRGLKYYYYKEEHIDVWGKDLEQHLSGIYKRQSLLCVIFVSIPYKEKLWAKFELKNALERAQDTTHEYVLPFKMDNTELPEISPTVKYLSLDEYDSKRLADAIYEKIKKQRRKGGFLYWICTGIRQFLSRLRNRFIVIGSLLLLLSFILRDRLTTVDVLANRLYERNMQTVKGSTCKDGWFSRSRGSGTCSGHGGVFQSMPDTLLPTQTMEQCREKAKEISWWPE